MTAKRITIVLFVFVALIHTYAASNTPPVIDNYTLDETSIEIDVTGRYGKRYLVETASQLSGPWNGENSFYPSNSTFSVVTNLNNNDPLTLYRITMFPSTNPPVWNWSTSYPLSFSPVHVTNLFLQWNAPSDPLDIAGYRIYQDDILLTELAPTTFSYQVTGLITGQLYRFRIESGNEDGNWTTNGLEIAIRPCPEDPATMASAPQQGVPTGLGDSIRFLFDASNAVQTAVATNIMESDRLAVLRGCVYDSDSNVLDGVVVTVLGEPDYGTTITRTNGQFDMAVNGGAPMVLCFNAYDYLPLQRTVDVPWQEGVRVPNIYMRHSNTNLTELNMTNASTMQVAQGETISDSDGSRRARVLIPANARASILSFEGTTQQVNRLTTRFTEYTEGSNGPDAMPGDLLPSVAYTYCVELGSLEAEQKINGRDVLFNTNVFFYVDNFIDIPAGIAVPMGYYDNDRGAWVPSPDGVCIQLMGTNEQGLARICANTNSIESDAAELAELEFTDEERRTLAQTYPGVSNSLWRVPIQHFSTYDCNYGVVPEAGAEEPQVPEAEGGETIPYPWINCGNSGIEEENQILTELLPLQGTPYSLVYSSRVAASNPKFKNIRIPISGDTLPASVTAIRLKMTVAGKEVEYDLPVQTNQTIDFTWDGTDAYGRHVKGTQPVSYSIEYLYPSYYAMPSRMLASFGAASGKAIPNMVPARTPAILAKRYKTAVGTFDASSRGLGGWMLNVHHVYDPISHRLYLGNGEVRTGLRIMSSSSETEWITDVLTDGLIGASDLAVGADGDIYVAVEDGLKRVDNKGRITTVASLSVMQGTVAVGPDDSIYLTEWDDLYVNQIYRIRPNGNITLFAGSGISGSRIPGVSAKQLNLSCLGMTFAPDGTAFLADTKSNLIWRIGTDGIAQIAAGVLDADGGYDGDGLPARESHLHWPLGLDYDEVTGRIALCDRLNCRVRVITPSGFLQTAAGNGSQDISGDGGPAINAGIDEPVDVDFGIDGSLFVVHESNDDPGGGRLRQILPDGRIITIAGEGDEELGKGRLAKSCRFGSSWSISVAPDGTIYALDKYNHTTIYQFRSATRPIRCQGDDLIQVASSDGLWIYIFDQDGRHLRTQDALTGMTNLVFGYTANGLLDTVSDRNGRITQIQRNPDETLASVNAPGGQTIAFSMDGSGYIHTATYPDSGQYQIEYTNSLLSAFRGPRGFQSTYDYDEQGNLTEYVRKTGGTGTLSRIVASDGWTVVHTNSMNVVQTFQTEWTDTGGQWSRVHYACGCGSDVDTYTDPGGLSSNVNSEGERTLSQTGPDPRFGIQAPIITWSAYQTPGGLHLSVSNQLTAIIPDPLSPVNFTFLTNLTTINGRTSQLTYDRTQQRQTEITPMDRTFIVEYDHCGRIAYARNNDLASIRFAYDANGEICAITNGSGPDARITVFSANNRGNLVESVNPESVSTRYEYDAGDQVTNVLIASSERIGYTKDKAGNILSIRSPGNKVHTFSYTPDNLMERYYAPAIGGVSNMTQWTYNPMSIPESIMHPDGTAEHFTYNSAGQLETHTYTDGGETYTYNGHMLSRIDSSNGISLEYNYDGTLLRDESWSGSVTGVVSRSYDNNLWITNIGVNGHSIAMYGYDADGLLTNAGELLIFRDPQTGLVTGTVLGVVQDFSSYNIFGEITNYQVFINATNFYTATWQRDKLGRITHEVIRDTAGSLTNEYAYDPAGRWLQVVTNGYVSQWNFDPDRNVTNVTHNGSTIATATYDAGNHLQQWNADTFHFTARGVLSTAVVSGISNRFIYNTCGTLQRVIRSSGTATNISYSHDGKGRILSRSINGTPTHEYLYQDALRPVSMFDISENQRTSFIYDKSDGAPAYMTTTGRTFRVIVDRIGSPLFVIDSVTGTIKQKLSYDVWGNIEYDSQTLLQPFGFAGGLYEPITGFVRFGMRDYSATINRWTSRDPILLSMDTPPNQYTYCENDPINRFDPDGCIDKKWVLVIRNSGTVATKIQGQSRKEEVWRARMIQKGDEIYVGPNSMARVKTANNQMWTITTEAEEKTFHPSYFIDQADWESGWEQFVSKSRKIYKYLKDREYKNRKYKQKRPNDCTSARG